jgi:hypothetical protein
MAEIPVERKERKSPLIWLVPLLLLAALAFFLLRPRGDGRDDGHADLSRDTAGVATDARSTTPAATPSAGATTASSTGGSAVLGDSAGTHAGSTAGSGERIVDVGTYFSAADRRKLAGRGIDLSNVEVQRVVSDRGFTVGSKKGEELFVMLDDRLNEGSAEKRVRIRPGQRLAIGGTLMEPPSAETKEERYRGLSAQETKELRAQDVYLHASTISQGR